MTFEKGCVAILLTNMKLPGLFKVQYHSISAADVRKNLHRGCEVVADAEATIT